MTKDYLLQGKQKKIGKRMNPSLVYINKHNAYQHDIIK